MPISIPPATRRALRLLADLRRSADELQKAVAELTNPDPEPVSQTMAPNLFALLTCVREGRLYLGSLDAVADDLRRMGLSLPPAELHSDIREQVTNRMQLPPGWTHENGPVDDPQLLAHMPERLLGGGRRQRGVFVWDWPGTSDLLVRIGEPGIDLGEDGVWLGVVGQADDYGAGTFLRSAIAVSDAEVEALVSALVIANQATIDPDQIAAIAEHAGLTGDDSDALESVINQIRDRP